MANYRSLQEEESHPLRQPISARKHQMGGERQKAHLRAQLLSLSRLLGLSLFEMGQSSDYQSPRQRRIFNCIGWFGDVFLCSLIACHFRFVGWFCHHPFPPSI
jgi:hypothetical protein